VYFAAFKARAVPFNCNFRYGVEEMRYLLDNADAEAVVVEHEFLPVAEAVRADLPQVRRWYALGAPPGAIPEWAVAYETAVRGGSTTPEPSSGERFGDDLILLYTGGTTGMPKGVMWCQGDLVNILGRGGNRLLGAEPAASFADFVNRLPDQRPGPALLVATPLMHGTGQLSALQTLLLAGTVVLLTGASLDPAEVWRVAADRHTAGIVIAGQAFGDPLLRHLEAHREDYDLGSLRLLTSSGLMWSDDNKAGFQALVPGLTVFDNYGSSEAIGIGGRVRDHGPAAEKRADEARFVLGPRSAVFTEDGRRVEPGSGERGLLAITGFIPLGYYKDEEKTARTFPIFEGRRWSVPGDWAEVEADGTVHLLGRGSNCINSGGEKIFPEEIEGVLKRHPLVADAAVVGVPDPRFGESVCAIVEPRPGAAGEFAHELPEFVGATLARFKMPRHVVVVESLHRAPNAKLDHPRLQALAAAHRCAETCPAGLV
jgi:fatty-acyl-CoA synthase